MIEITARLLKGPAYLAGEMVECSITFSNPEDPSLKKSHSYRYVCLCVRFSFSQKLKTRFFLHITYLHPAP